MPERTELLFGEGPFEKAVRLDKRSGGATRIGAVLGFKKRTWSAASVAESFAPDHLVSSICRLKVPCGPIFAHASRQKRAGLFS